MCEVFDQLQFREQERICVLHAPFEFQSVLLEMINVTEIDREIDPGYVYGFVLAFLQTPEDVHKVSKHLAPGLTRDSIVWFAYPKRTAPSFRSHLPHSQPWKELLSNGVESLQQCTIEPHWNAAQLRFSGSAGIPQMKSFAARYRPLKS
ncbi:MAG: hypothetical protein F6K11_16330 [Leptolyngbya sp. SIO3F4]|nr:hypothetical protein [Leptolyngbya sp. SIO3F4]